MEESIVNPSRETPLHQITRESWFNGGLTICQPVQGYRYTADPVLLAGLIPPLPSNGHVLDLGCGCGIISLILAFRNPTITVTAVEIQTALADSARRNIADNHLARRIRLCQMDINTLTPDDLEHPADLIVSNPPYKKKGTGRLNPNQGKAVARHEVSLTIHQLFQKAVPLLSRSGTIRVIFPTDRIRDLETAIGNARLSIVSIRPIHVFAHTPAFRFLVSAARTPVTSPEILPPFVIRHRDGTSTKAYDDLFIP